MALTAVLYRSDDDRLAARHAVEVGATLRDPENAPLDTIVLDLSTSGFRATVPEPIAPGSPVRLGLPGLGVNPATVIWQSGTVIGCQFERPIPPEAIARAQSAHTVVDGAFPEERAGSPAIDAAPIARRSPMAGFMLPSALVISAALNLFCGTAMLTLMYDPLAQSFS